MSESTDITRDILKDMLAKACSEAHYVYALMNGLPKKNFYIYRDFDNYAQEDGLENEEANIFSLQEFLAKRDTMHPEDTFTLTFKVHLDRIDAEFADCYSDSVSIWDNNEFTLVELQNAVDDFLESYCERCLLDNHPFCLTPEIVSRFGFTDEDIKVLQPRLERFNTDAKKRIREEYDALARLDFIRLESNESDTV